MDDALRASLEHAVIGGRTFEPAPRWHFLFLENRDILKDLLRLLPDNEAEEDITDAVAAFSDRSAAAAADACAGLNRMFAAAGDAGCRFSEDLLRVFSGPHSQSLKEALGVPADYMCIGAIVFTENMSPAEQEAVKWDIFSYLK